MAFIDGNNGENFISEGLIPAPHTLVFYCPIHKKSLEPQECFDCGMFVNVHCMMGVERVVMAYFEHQKAQYNQTMQCQMAQQAINIVTQQIH